MQLLAYIGAESVHFKKIEKSLRISGCPMFCSIRLILRKTVYTTFRSIGDAGAVLQLPIVAVNDTFKESNFLKSVQPGTIHLQLTVNNLVLICRERTHLIVVYCEVIKLA